MENSSGQTNYTALFTLTTVFFFWGFIAAGNSVFIPFCKHYFSLDQFQSQLIDFAFYIAYFVGALSFFVLGQIKGQNLISVWGYKSAIIRGLMLSAFGALIMIIMVVWRSYGGMLIGLFMVGLGFSIQQTAAQPLAIELGPRTSGAARISLGGALNSFGTALGPIVVSVALFGNTSGLSDQAISSLSLSKIIVLYTAVGLLFVVAALLFHFSKSIPTATWAPNYYNKNNFDIGFFLSFVLPVSICFGLVLASYNEKIKNLFSDSATLEFLRLFLLFIIVSVIFIYLLFYTKWPRKKIHGIPNNILNSNPLRLGMLAIFVYVGVEVSIVSNLGELLRHPAYGSIQTSDIAPLISLYWGSLMMGRWAGAVGAFDWAPKIQKGVTLLMPHVAFGVVILLNYAYGTPIQTFRSYWPFVLLGSVLISSTKHNSSVTLIVLSIFGALSILFAILLSDFWGVQALLFSGIMCSILWPCIFNLALGDLNGNTGQGSALLIMMILGGAIIPPFQGKIADLLAHLNMSPEQSIRYSYLIIVIGFLFLTCFGLKVRKELMRKGINI